MRFTELLKDSPAFLSANDLIKIGVFGSKIAIYKARERREAPPAIHTGKRMIRFPKDQLILWLESRKEYV